jgi:hypothetical protein
MRVHAWGYVCRVEVWKCKNKIASVLWADALSWPRIRQHQKRKKQHLRVMQAMFKHGRAC